MDCPVFNREKGVAQGSLYADDLAFIITAFTTCQSTKHRLPIQRTTLARYLVTYVDDKLSFHQHCNKMLQKIQTNSVIFKYLTRSHTSSYKVRLLVRNAFILPYFQLIYTITGMMLTIPKSFLLIF